MILPFKLPDGPIHSFQALPQRLPECVQAKLKALSAKCAGLTGEDLLRAQMRLNEYADKVWDVLGFEFVRREFLPVLRA
jgi:hypothetical protein